jgi:hypothetical protein
MYKPRTVVGSEMTNIAEGHVPGEEEKLKGSNDGVY